MRQIDADALTEKYGDWYVEEGSEEGFIGTIKQLIDAQPTIQSEQRWIPVEKESVIQAGYEGREVRFRIRGRLFAIRELAQ